MARPRFLSQFVASVIDNNTAATQFRIADNGVGVLRQPQIEVDELLNMDLFVPATNTTTGAGTFNQSLLDKANHREESGNYLLIVKTDNPCHIAVSNGLNYGDYWNQTDGVYNDIITPDENLYNGFVIAYGHLYLPLPDLMPTVYNSIINNLCVIRIFRHVKSSGIYIPIETDLELPYLAYCHTDQIANYAGQTLIRAVTYKDDDYQWVDALTEISFNKGEDWAAGDVVSYTLEPITRIYGNLLVMKCDNPINLSIINTSADDVAGKVYLLKVIDELE